MSRIEISRWKFKAADRDRYKELCQVKMTSMEFNFEDINIKHMKDSLI